MLSDPYAHRLHFPAAFSREAARGDGPNDGMAVLGQLPRREWGKPAPRPGPRHTHDTVIYEAHVKGFTARENSGVAAAHRGTFAGLIEKIPYLHGAGDHRARAAARAAVRPPGGQLLGLHDPELLRPPPRLRRRRAGGRVPRDGAAMHAAGIEVWLDVVYNHTCEGDQSGPTYNLRGIDNDSYYLVAEDGSYSNDSGCGNTTQGGRPRHASARGAQPAALGGRMGVDGFRFDLASILARDADGAVDPTDPRP